MTISEAQLRMACGIMTSKSLLESCIERIHRFDGAYSSHPGINAIISISDTCEAEAKTLDAERTAGHVRGPLHGIPILVKDNIDVTGMPTTGGNCSLRNHRPIRDAFVITRLKRAGAIILGKTNMDEFAWGSTTVSGIRGQTFNAYDQRRDPGGSSGGSAAAVAARFAPAALGTDTGGSLRIPAAHGNLVSMRMTFGEVSRAGCLPMSYHQDMPGPIAHNVRDVAHLLAAIAGRDPTDRFTLSARHGPAGSGPSLAHLPNLSGHTLAILANEEYRGSRVVETSIARAIEVLKSLGSRIVYFNLPQHIVDALKFSGVSLTLFEMRDAIDEYFANAREAISAGYTSSSTHSEKLTFSDIVASRSAIDRVQPWLEAMLCTDRSEYLRRLAQRRAMIDELTKTITELGFDALIYPSVRDTARPAGDEPPPNNGQLSPLTGFPAITVPAGLTDAGLPVGIEFMGLPYTDEKLLSIAWAFEQATNHARHMPPFLGLE